MRQGLNKLTAILLVALMLLAVLPVSALGTEQYSDPVMPGISLTSILPGETNVVTYVFYNGENVADTQRVKDGETLVEPGSTRRRRRKSLQRMVYGKRRKVYCVRRADGNG